MPRPILLTGKRLTRFETIIATTQPTGKALKDLKTSFQELERKARKINERRQHIRDLQRGVRMMEQQEQRAFQHQEEQFNQLIAKEERKAKKAEKAEKKALKQAHANVRKCVLTAHFEVRKLTSSDQYEVSRHEEHAFADFSYTSNKQLKQEIDKRSEQYRQQYKDEHTDFYSNQLKILLRITSEESAVAKNYIPIDKLPMRSALTLRRDWLKYAEGIYAKSFDDMNGQCVYELLINHLNNYWTTVNKEQLFAYFQSAVQNKGAEYLKGEPFNGTFTMDSGVNVDMLKYLCDKKHISLYGFDADDKCFVKQPSRQKSNYRPICFYHIDCHMYLITGATEVKSIGSHREEKTTVASSLLEIEKREKKETHEYIEAESFAGALQMASNQTTDSIIYLKQRDITAEVIKYIRNTKNLPKVKAQGHKIREIYLKGTTIICDPNTDDYTWKDIKAICDKAGVPFKNQQIGGLIRTLGKQFNNGQRRVLTQEEKVDIVKTQQNLCVLCDKSAKEWQYDHRVPLNAGGSNDIENFQALCVPCHLQKTKEEAEAGDFIKYDPVASTFNKSALEIIESKHFKQWAFVERLKEKELPDMPVRKLDHAKCRRNIVLHSQYEWPKFSVMDSPTEYDGGDIKCGLYFVETDNYFPFRGNGWYNYAMVKEALTANIIQSHQITHQFIASFQLPADYFKKFAEYLIDTTRENGLDKLIINSMVGCWAINRSSFETLQFNANKHEASAALIRDGVFVSSFDIDGTSLYAIHEKKEIQKDDMFLPLYHQVISLEAMGLYKLEQLIKSHGGIPLERNTDAILYQGPEINIDNITHADGTQKYRYDDTKRLRVESVCSFSRNGSYQVPVVEYSDVNDQDDFDELAQLIYDSDQGCFVSGFAGVGKTYFTNKLINLIESNGKKCIKLAPTRKAASHIKGKTIHKFYMNLALSNNYEKKILQSLQYTDYMLVDEISMVKEWSYRFFTMLKRYAPQLKFIIVGDYDQLPPVNDEYKGNYDQSWALYHLCDGQRLRLEKCRRSDEKLFKLYNGVRLGTADVDISQFAMKTLTRLNIAYSHETRKRVNATCMERFREGRPFLECDANERNPKTQAVQIFEGMPIVSFRNDSRKGLENSEMYVVRNIDESTGTFSIEVGEPETRKCPGNQKKTEIVAEGESYILTVKASEFKHLFYPGFCITIHVSQGCSFDEPYTIYDWNFYHMNNRAKYVALSRAKKYEYIQIVA